jgi:hypothetical protein
MAALVATREKDNNPESFWNQEKLNGVRPHLIISKTK